MKGLQPINSNIFEDDIPRNYLQYVRLTSIVKIDIQNRLQEFWNGNQIIFIFSKHNEQQELGKQSSKETNNTTSYFYKEPA